MFVNQPIKEMRILVFLLSLLILASCNKEPIYPDGYPGTNESKHIDSNVTVIPGESGKAHLSSDFAFNGNYNGHPNNAIRVVPFDNFSTGAAYTNGHFSNYSYHADQDINVNVKGRIYFTNSSGQFWYAIYKNGNIVSESYKYEKNAGAVDTFRDIRAWNLSLNAGDSIAVYFRSYGTTIIKEQSGSDYSYFEVLAY